MSLRPVTCRDCSKTLNFDECVAKGCSLQAAMLSPAFKVREFEVNDLTLYPIALSWSPSAGAAAPETMEVEGEADAAAPKSGASNTVVFTKFNSVPNTKMIVFKRKDTFTLTAAYDTASVPVSREGFKPPAVWPHGCSIARPPPLTPPRVASEG